MTAEAKAVCASRWETPSSGRTAVPMRVRSVAYAVSAVASAGLTGGVRIQRLNSGGADPGESRSAAVRVSHGSRPSSTRCSAPGTAGTGSTACWLIPSSAACRDTEAVAMTPGACRAWMVRAAKVLPS